MNPELIDALLNDELPEAERLEAEGLLAADEGAREELVRQASIDAALRELWRDGEDADATSAFARGVLARLESASDRAVARSVLSEIIEEREWRQRAHPWWGWRRRAESRRRDREDRQRYHADWWKAAAVAALFIGLAVLVMQRVSVPRDSVAPGLSDALLARVTADKDAVWAAETHGRIRSDGWVRAGQLDLRSGNAEVAFNNGAKVLLQGPVRFRVETDARGYLEVGRIAAEASGKAAGFVVNTPRLTAVDVGTRFGITVGASGESEVHVLQGAVEVSRVSGNSLPMLIREGGAVRADDRPLSQLEPVEFRGEDYALPGSPRADNSLPYVAYHFEDTGSVLKQSGSGLVGSAYESSLHVDEEFPSKPKRSPGLSGNALVFRSGEGLSLGSVGSVEKNQAFTASLWVKLPPRETGADANAGGQLLALAGPSGTIVWELSWNGEETAGTLGALRVSGQGGGVCIGATDLRDGRWHHIAVRFVGGGSDLGLLSHLYVDGMVERISALRKGVWTPATSNGDLRLIVGAVPSQGVSGFTGQVDEVYWYQGAATPTLLQQQASEGFWTIF